MFIPMPTNSFERPPIHRKPTNSPNVNLRNLQNTRSTRNRIPVRKTTLDQKTINKPYPTEFFPALWRLTIHNASQLLNAEKKNSSTIANGKVYKRDCVAKPLKSRKTLEIDDQAHLSACT